MLLSFASARRSPANPPTFSLGVWISQRCLAPRAKEKVPLRRSPCGGPPACGYPDQCSGFFNYTDPTPPLRPKPTQIYPDLPKPTQTLEVPLRRSPRGGPPAEVPLRRSPCGGPPACGYPDQCSGFFNYTDPTPPLRPKPTQIYPDLPKPTQTLEVPLRRFPRGGPPAEVPLRRSPCVRLPRPMFWFL